MAKLAIDRRIVLNTDALVVNQHTVHDCKMDF